MLTTFNTFIAGNKLILPLIIDTTQMMSQWTSLTKENVNNMLDNIAKGLAANFARNLEQTAVQELHQSRAAYLRNIIVVDSGRLEGTVILDYSKEPIVRMIEEGIDAFDMKEGFLMSPKVKTGKNGKKYLTIPFRQGTPDIVGDSDVFVGTMPIQVYNVVKKKPMDVPVSGGGTRSKGLMLKEIPEQYQVKSVRAAIIDNKGNVQFKAYESKNSIFEGIVKQNDPATGQNSYHSFRRVSEGGIDKDGNRTGSDPDAWIHPGIQKYNLVQKTLSKFNVETELGLQLDNELNKLGLL